MYETSYKSEDTSGSWDGTYSYFPITTGPLRVRGGGYGNGQDAGIFAFVRDSGTSYSPCSWRASLTLPSADAN